ncbi:stalk domain-containing protein [Paenibacillus lautus]|uniref:stalk domain-containing protein n=1 Tax=Paenibacillus lautus TaxID=1401 RepID=UPI003D2BF33E
MKKKKIVLAMTALLMLGGTAVYAAAPQIKGTIQNFKYVLNGKAWSHSGKPILVNGQYYLPVSTVKEATKTNITIDKAKGTVHIGEKLKETPILNEQVKYYDAALTRDDAYTGDFKEVILTKGSLPSVYLFPQGQYQTLVLDICAIEKDATVVIKNKDTKEELKSLFVSQDITEQIEINITGMKQVEVEVKGKAVVYPSSHYK